MACVTGSCCGLLEESCGYVAVTDAEGDEEGLGVVTFVAVANLGVCIACVAVTVGAAVGGLVCGCVGMGDKAAALVVTVATDGETGALTGACAREAVRRNAK